MDGTNYTDLLEALEMNISVVIIAVVKDGTLVDWAPASEYSSLQHACSKHSWPEDAHISLLYGLDALLLYGDQSLLANRLPAQASSLPKP